MSSPSSSMEPIKETTNEPVKEATNEQHEDGSSTTTTSTITAIPFRDLKIAPLPPGLTRPVTDAPEFPPNFDLRTNTFVVPLPSCGTTPLSEIRVKYPAFFSSNVVLPAKPPPADDRKRGRSLTPPGSPQAEVFKRLKIAPVVEEDLAEDDEEEDMDIGYPLSPSPSV